jgi:glycosyltransferase involved in cell wall biosynthesis
MFVTVAICTWNRARLLDRTLAEMTKLNIPPQVRWEVLVVNNRCTDDTDQVIAKYENALPIRRLYEVKPGKSNAANCAVANAQGDLILWTDDDVLVDPNWLAGYVRAAEANPQAEFFGGAILPWFESKPPRWLVRHMSMVSNCFAQREVPFAAYQPITRKFVPYGANMATRRSCFAKCSFDARLGPLEKTEVRGEDVALMDGLILQGSQGIWVPDASVQHFIPAERLTTQYVWTWFSGYGKTLVRQNEISGSDNAARLFGFPRWMLRKFVESYALSWLMSPFKNSLWIKYYLRAAVCRGMMHESKTSGGRILLRKEPTA